MNDNETKKHIENYINKFSKPVMTQGRVLMKPKTESSGYVSNADDKTEYPSSTTTCASSTAYPSWSGIPKRAFDLEYSTQLRREMEYLADHGIHPTYVRKDPRYYIPTYKYTKTPQLFDLLSEFWKNEYLMKNKGGADNG